jgi:mannose-6-phosphate isomerase
MFGTDFPLLIKFIDAADDLSVQVHPGDELAAERHQSFGKTEMWYVIQADKNAQLISGFRPEIDREKYETALKNKDILPILQTEFVKHGDVFFIPAGRVHAICKGILLAEIQQTSDITYRIFDYNRTDDNGKERELHLEQAFDALNFDDKNPAKTVYSMIKGKSAKIISCPFFETNIIEFESVFEKNYDALDSFVIYICTEGNFTIQYPGAADTKVKAGETVLLPAEMSEIQLISKTKCVILEVYIGNYDL